VLLLALYIGLFMNGAVFSVGLTVTRKILPSGKELQRLSNWSLRYWLPSFASYASLFGRRVWRVLASFVVLCSAGASYYMTFMNVVIGYGIIASVMTTDIDLSKEVVGLHFILWLVASAPYRCCLSGATAAAIRLFTSCARRNDPKRRVVLLAG
jgi:KDO II ethanolaminephosphotransferase